MLTNDPSSNMMIGSTSAGAFVSRISATSPGRLPASRAMIATAGPLVDVLEAGSDLDPCVFGPAVHADAPAIRAGSEVTSRYAPR